MLLNPDCPGWGAISMSEIRSWFDANPDRVYLWTGYAAATPNSVWAELKTMTKDSPDYVANVAAGDISSIVNSDYCDFLLLRRMTYGKSREYSDTTLVPVALVHWGITYKTSPTKTSEWPGTCDRCKAPAYHSSQFIYCSKKCCKERT